MEIMRVLPKTTSAAVADAPRSASGGKVAKVVAAPLARLARVRAAVVADWHGPRVYAGALVVGVLSALTVAAFYRNHFGTDIYPDTVTYVTVARHIFDGGPFMDALRAPGYPLLIAATFAAFGVGNLAAVQCVQAVFFILTALEAYALAYLLLRRTWMACVLGLLIGCNIVLISYVKPILTEGIAMFLVMTLALVFSIFVRTLRARDLWLLAACALVLYLTRLEWAFAVVPLFGFALFVAWQRGRLRALLPHVLGAVLVLYALLGLYVAANAAQTGYRGLSVNQNIELLGKVMQYHMQNEAPPQYAREAAIVDSYVRRGVTNPWTIANEHQEFARDHFALAAAYSSSIIKAHPVEFIADTLPVLVTTLAPTYLYSPIAMQGHFGPELSLASKLFVLLHDALLVFPLLALALLWLLLRRQTRRLAVVQTAAGIALLVVYDVTMTSFGNYTDYGRMHAPVDPLMLLLVWGAVLAGASLLYQRWVRPHVQSARSARQM